MNYLVNLYSKKIEPTVAADRGSGIQDLKKKWGWGHQVVEADCNVWGGVYGGGEWTPQEQNN